MTLDRAAARQVLERWTGGRKFPDEAYDYVIGALADCDRPALVAIENRDEAGLVASALRHYARHYEPVADPSRITTVMELAKRIEREASV